MDDVINTKQYVGKLGEDAAVKYLKKNGYSIILRNTHEGRSEIDVIALKDKTLVFVEVKTRSYADGKEYFSRPADAVNNSKRSYLIRGANKFCSENGAKYAGFYKRFDIIEVYLTRRKDKYQIADIKHFENSVHK
ncbi:MAG: YraN family protein [Clostridia bacterium]|nr:YraN family protein [Clostridia bacterium]